MATQFGYPLRTMANGEIRRVSGGQVYFYPNDGGARKRFQTLREALEHSLDTTIDVDHNAGDWVRGLGYTVLGESHSPRYSHASGYSVSQYPDRAFVMHIESTFYVDSEGVQQRKTDQVGLSEDELVTMLAALRGE